MESKPEKNVFLWRLIQRKKRQPTPVFLPRKSHGWRRLAGYSPQGHKELDMTEQLSIVNYIDFFLNVKLTLHYRTEPRLLLMYDTFCILPDLVFYFI